MVHQVCRLNSAATLGVSHQYLISNEVKHLFSHVAKHNEYISIDINIKYCCSLFVFKNTRFSKDFPFVYVYS